MTSDLTYDPESELINLDNDNLGSHVWPLNGTTVLFRYCDYHPKTKSPKIGCCVFFSNVPNVRLVL